MVETLEAAARRAQGRPDRHLGLLALHRPSVCSPVLLGPPARPGRQPIRAAADRPVLEAAAAAACRPQIRPVLARVASNHWAGRISSACARTTSPFLSLTLACRQQEVRLVLPPAEMPPTVSESWHPAAAVAAMPPVRAAREETARTSAVAGAAAVAAPRPTAARAEAAAMVSAELPITTDIHVTNRSRSR